MPSFIPDFWLVLGYQLAWVFSRKRLIVSSSRASLKTSPRGLYWPINSGMALVKPDDGRAQWLAVFIEVNHRAALGCDGNARNPVWRYIS